MGKDKLIIFVKNEEAGEVKTRLARSVGDEKALEIYRQLLAYTARTVNPLEVEKEVWYTRFIADNDVWEKGSFNRKKQFGEDLGERMKHAFEVSFGKEAYRKVILIGSDCAELSSSILKEAFQKLDTAEVVIGPAADGGYYLIGMSRFIPEVFKDVEWSTDMVFRKTVENLNEAEAAFATLPLLNDVDTVDDWERVKKDSVRIE